MFYRPEARPESLRYNPAKALVAPRPIAWVSTIDPDGRRNLAPFSYFNLAFDQPPILMIAPVGVKTSEHGAGGARKDTLTNILATGEFVVSIVGRDQADAMNASSAGFPADVDEFEAAGVEAAPSVLVKPPRVANSPASFECTLITRVSFEDVAPGKNVGAVFGEAVGVHIRDDVVVDGLVDVTRYQPLARLGYQDYAAVGEVFQLGAPGGAKGGRG